MGTSGDSANAISYTIKYSTPRKYKGFREVGKGWFCTEGIRKRNKKVAVFIPTISLDATWVKSNKGMKSSTKPVPFSQTSAIDIEFVASLHALAKKMYDAGAEERKSARGLHAN